MDPAALNEALRHLEAMREFGPLCDFLAEQHIPQLQGLQPRQVNLKDCAEAFAFLAGIIGSVSGPETVADLAALGLKGCAPARSQADALGARMADRLRALGS